MRFRKSIFMILFTILISATSMASFAGNSSDVEVTWQDDLDESKKGNLTVQQYDVQDLYFASQGNGSSEQNRILNERTWENESIIFDSERIKSSAYYIDAKIKTKNVGVDENVLFYKDSGYFGDESKQSLKAWGYFVPSKSGYYKFEMISDDGSYLSMFIKSNSLNDLQGNEDVLVNDMSVSSYNANESKSVYLEAKKPYPILVKYFNWGGDGLFTFNSSYSKDDKWKGKVNYSPVNQNDLYPSKKKEFMIKHGDTQNLKNMQVTVKDRLSLLSGQSSLEIDKLKLLLKESEKMVLEYYNYTQNEMNKSYDDMEAAMFQLNDTSVVVKTPYPDDFLIDAKGKLMIQKYMASDINAVYEGGGSNAYNNNKANWTNESYIFNPDRKDGDPKLYTAEIIRAETNAATEDVFFYDGGGDYGFDAKEIREGWGYFVPNTSGYYQFESLFDDGIRAYLYKDKNINDLKYNVNESTQLSSQYAIGVFSKTSSTIRLEAGKAYPIYINHFNWHGPNKLALRYRFSSSSNVTGAYKDV
ncbi:MAG: PA14 domain-containing protein, partial [Acidaminobacteraceae bacterium]